ncbi:MAG TPA: hypothetical protein VMT71_17405 [Syntrophorhabdales bacterium]|nr:hypothetical protein [Syntrophorhabdales bacterium]
MFIRSTGLGRTLLTARVANIQTTDMVPATLEPSKTGATEPMRMLMVMEVVHPVHWTVRAFVDPADLRRMAKLVLTNPALILRGIKFFFSKSPVYEEPGKAEIPIGAPAMAQAGSTPAQASLAGPGPVPQASPPKAGPGPIPPAPPRHGPGPIPPRR